MYAFLARHFRMEGGGQQPAGTHCDNSSRPRQLDRVGRVLRLGRLNLGQDFNVRTHPFHPRPADEDGVHRWNPGLRGAEVQALEIEVGFEGVALAAEGVAPDGHVQAAEGLLRGTGKVSGRIGDIGGQENHSRAGSVDGKTFGDAFPQGSDQLEGAGQFVDGRGFSSGNDQPVQAVKLLRPADADGFGAGGLCGAEVLAEVALQRQHADAQARTNARGSG